MSSDGESFSDKFAHLLQPIRDLALNWNIDIAHELEDYLDDLEEITISFDEEDQNLNFAEAALLIQGSTCIYSRKVEFLYTLVFQTLDLIADRKRAGAGAAADASTGDVDEDVVTTDEPEFLVLDCLPEAKGINLGDDFQAYAPEVDTGRNLLAPTPIALSMNLDDKPVRPSATFQHC